MRLDTTELTTPLGCLTLVSSEQGLCGVSFDEGWPSLAGQLKRRFGEVSFRNHQRPGEAMQRVAAFFEGELEALSGIDVDPGGTPFQESVWAALREIPVGSTTSYSELARRLDRPGAARAVASANATNPVSVVIPCHRVIHADGSLSGYGGGVERKRWLLRHEGVLLF